MTKQIAIAGLALLALSFGANRPGPAGAEGWDTMSTKMDVNGRSYDLILRYVPGDKAWAEGIAAFAPQAIPVLEQVIGTPYPGPPALRITERTGPEMYGAAGIAACNDNMCALAVGPDPAEKTLLHEMAHVWTYAFKNRWLAEGTAEFSAVEAAGRLGIRVTDPPNPRNFQPSYPLDQWGGIIDFGAADDAAIRHEYEGYDRSTRLMQIIHSRAADALGRAYAALVSKPQISVDSQAFMDALEDAGGGNHDDLFKGWVFPTEMGGILAERRAARDTLAAVSNRLAAETPELPPDALGPARQLISEWKFAEANAARATVNAGIDTYLGGRDRLNAFRAAAEEAGLAYPVPFDHAKISLDYAPVIAQIDTGYAAIDAYRKAREQVLAPRSTQQKLGLLGKDPDGRLDDARGDFGWGRFDESIQAGRDAQDAVDSAAGAGVRNAVIGIVLLLVVCIGGVFAVRWALAGQPAPAES